MQSFYLITKNQKTITHPKKHLMKLMKLVLMMVQLCTTNLLTQEYLDYRGKTDYQYMKLKQVLPCYLMEENLL